MFFSVVGECTTKKEHVPSSPPQSCGSHCHCSTVSLAHEDENIHIVQQPVVGQISASRATGGQELEATSCCMVLRSATACKTVQDLSPCRIPPGAGYCAVFGSMLCCLIVVPWSLWHGSAFWGIWMMSTYSFRRGSAKKFWHRCCISYSVVLLRQVCRAMKELDRFHHWGFIF